MGAPMGKRIPLAVALFVLTGVLMVLHLSLDQGLASIQWLPSARGPQPTSPDIDVQRRVRDMENKCHAPNPFEEEYGRTNIRLSRAYEGSHYRLRRLLHKTLRGQPITISAIGGSITKGHQVGGNEIWFYKFGEWLQNFVGGDSPIAHINGAAPATGSDYFSFCFPLHIPDESDLVLVELAVNDEGIPEHVENMENLLRGLLDMPHQPAVILVEALAFSNGGMGGGGGRMHLPVAQYYDVPVINQRHPLANHFARYPQLVPPYFTENYWGDPDMRHINPRGHRDLGMLVASFIQDVGCEMIAEEGFNVPTAEDEKLIRYGPVRMEGKTLKNLQKEEQSWPTEARTWLHKPKNAEEEELTPGMWMGPHEYGQVPRMRVLDGWNPDVNHIVPPFHPICMSTRSADPEFALVPVEADGWENWVHPDFLDKPYLIARQPGSTVSFSVSTALGVVKMYSLKSKTFGLGTVECWVDEERDQSVEIEGYWDKDPNIGRFATIREGLSPGEHVVFCQLLEKTADPEGGHEFRIISVMSV